MMNLNALTSCVGLLVKEVDLVKGWQQFQKENKLTECAYTNKDGDFKHPSNSTTIPFKLTSVHC